MAASLDDLLPRADQERVAAAIRDAESRTSGEIKVHLDERCPGDAMERAKALFAALGLTRTAACNGVLVYLAVRDRKYAILGDSGIHGAAGPAFWDEAAARMRACFARGALGDGLCAAIAAVGERLAAAFPRRADDQNELSDDISH